METRNSNGSNDSEKEQDSGSIGVVETGNDAGGSEFESEEAQGATGFKTGMAFEALGLREEVLEAIRTLGFSEVVEVQAATFPLIMGGKDVIVQARTGSGKTAAFGIPMAQELLKPETVRVQALTLCPTRELAKQVAAETAALGGPRGIKVLPVYGGAPLGPQISALRDGVHSVVGTPGRVLDHLKRGTLKTDSIRLLVLDECDEMLSMGFIEEIQKVLSFLPEDRQTLLFSATVSEDVKRLAGRYMRDPQKLSLSDDFIGVKEVDHIYYLLQGAGKHRDLIRVLEEEDPASAIIFCNTRGDTAMVAGYLRKRGYQAEHISSDLTQAERERVMLRAREGRLKFLVATDVAARGIDIQDLACVINYAFPDSADMYVHRTGRTGRAGKAGTAISLIAPTELGSFYYMKLTYGIQPREKRLPTEQELATGREVARFETLSGAFEEDPTPEFASLARRIWHSVRGETIFGNLLARYFESDTRPRRTAPRAPTAGPDEGGGGPRRDEGRPSAQRSGGRPGRRYEGDSDRGRPRRHEGDSDRGRSRRHGGDSDRGRPRRHEGDSDRGRSGQPDRGSREEGVRLYVNVGRRDGVDVQQLKGFLGEAAGVNPAELGWVQMRDTHSYVRVHPELSSRVIEKATGKSLGSKSVVVEPAKKG